MADSVSINPPSKVECIVCREQIFAGAKKCIHCDSHQDWRRFVFFSNTVLALLVALVSVSATALPEINRLLTIKYSSTHLSKRGIKGNGIEILANNSGTEDSSFLDASLIGTFASGPMKMTLEELGANFPIGHGRPRTILLLVPPYYVPNFLDWPNDSPINIFLDIKVSEFDGSIKSIDLPIDYAEYGQFRLATKDAYDQFRRSRSQLVQ